MSFARLVVGLLTCGAMRQVARAQAPRPHATRIASREVTIYRDEYGIPHVFARTDAGAVYGFAYAQSEDSFWRLEENFALALGRGAELHGEMSLQDDRLNRALAIPTLAQLEYRRLPPRVRVLCDAFAQGVNDFLATHATVRPRLLQRIEPWYPLAFIRYTYYQRGFARDPALDSATFRTTLSATDDMGRYQLGGSSDATASLGSNGWVLAPARSASGHALLLINPHLPFFGPGQVYEGHLHSDEGWDFSGYARIGLPFPYVGHNASLGWVSTDNDADQADVYEETFDDPAHPLAYRYAGGYRTATLHLDTILVRSADGLEPRTFQSVRTNHGPVVGARHGKLLAIKLAHLADDGWLGEWYAMTHARSVHALRRAMRPLAMLFGNVMAADQQGNIYYLYNGAIPRRDPAFDWARAVDGSDVRTEWRGFHTIDELPQLLNPPTGWMQNCNTSPFQLTRDGNPHAAAFPSYMARDDDNPRGLRSRRLLSEAVTSPGGVTFAQWSAMAFDTRVLMADSVLPALLRDATMDSNRSHRTSTALQEVVDTLRSWNHRADTASVATAIFELWRERVRHTGSALDDRGHVAALASVVDSLSAARGTWHLHWGEVNRLQRLDEATDTAFDESRPSVAIPAVNGSEGAIFTFYTHPRSTGTRYGTAGASYVSVVEFGSRVHAMAVHVLGSSAHPTSPHFVDQAPLYARGMFRDAWFTTTEVRQHARTRYHPAQPDVRRQRAR